MKDDIAEMAYHVAALNRLSLQRSEDMAQKAILYMLYVYQLLRDRAFKVRKALDGQDVAADLSTLVKD